MFRKISRKTWLFNLDCHVSVIADLKSGFRGLHATKVISWSLSGHNFVFRRIFTQPDPVAGINANSWSRMDSRDVEKFRTKYLKFLRCFDGFIVTHTPVFIEIFSTFKKPILVVVSTRYEHPYTTLPQRWQALDDALKAGSQCGRLTIVANNRGDADYFSDLVGLQIRVVPSLCDYIAYTDRKAPDLKIVQAKSEDFARRISIAIGGPWQTKREALGNRYSFSELGRVAAVVYIPYNTSTMTLFELATIGVPVLVPSASFLKRLASEEPGVMSELVFANNSRFLGKERSSGQNLTPGSASGDFLDWWIGRADFYDTALMPNVLQFESWSDPVFQTDFRLFRESVKKKVDTRNAALRAQRHELLANFVSGL